MPQRPTQNFNYFGSYEIHYRSCSEINWLLDQMAGTSGSWLEAQPTTANIRVVIEYRANADMVMLLFLDRAFS